MAHKKRRGIIVAGVGGLLFALGGFMGGLLPGLMPLWLAAPGFVVFVLAMLYVQLLLRCPSCGARWKHLALQGGIFSIDGRIVFCPYCGRDIDEDLPEPTDG
jgi:hypothetical protein